MASNEKPLISFCTHAVGSQLGDVGHSKLPPSLCQEDPLNIPHFSKGASGMIGVSGQWFQNEGAPVR
jgi:hypothetical protein